MSKSFCPIINSDCNPDCKFRLTHEVLSDAGMTDCAISARQSIIALKSEIEHLRDTMTFKL